MQKQLITKVFSALLIVMLALGAMSVQPAQAATVVLNSWANAVTTGVSGNNATIPAGNLTVSGGANRLFVAAVCMELSGANTMTSLNMALGGTTLTPIGSTGGANATEHCYMGYLLNSQIPAGSNALTVPYNISGGATTVTGAHVYWASYSGVNQTAPINDWNANTNGGTNVTFGQQIDYLVDGVTFFVAGNIGTPAAMTAPLGPPAFSQLAAAITSNGHSSTIGYITTVPHAANGNYAAGTNVAFTGTTGARSSLVVASLRPFIGSTAAGTATATAASSTTINVSMPYTNDDNGNNTYTVDYKLSAAGVWTNWITNATHTASPYTTTITGLSPSTSYDVRVTYNDADTVTGTNPQTISNITTPVTNTRFTGNGSPLTQNYTLAADEDLLVVSIVTDGNNVRTGGAPTYNGIALTQADVNRVSNNETITELWYLILPPAGAAYQISIPNTSTEDLYVIVSSYKAQSAANKFAFDVANGGINNNANPSVSVTTTANGDVIVGALGTGRNAAPTLNAGATLLSTNLNGGFTDSGAYTRQVTAGAYTMSWTLSGNDDWGFILVAFKEVPLVTSTTAGVATATASSSTTINVSMPYTNDENGNNTYTVDYKLSSAGGWTNWVTNAAHTVSPYATTITGLSPSTSYDVRVTYNDADTVTGTNPQTISNITTPATPIAGSWTNVYSGAGTTVVNAVSATSTSTCTAGAGSNRVVLVAFSASAAIGINSNFSMTAPAVTFGGVTVNEITSTKTTPDLRPHAWIGYIKEANIPAGAQSISMSFTKGGANNSAVANIKIFCATYTNVDQTSVYSYAIAGPNTAAQANSPTISMNVGANEQAIIFTPNSVNATVVSYTPVSYASVLFHNTGGYPVDIAHRPIPGLAVVAENTLITWNSFIGRSSILGVSLKRAPLKTDQTITFGVLADKTYGDADFAVSATASSTLAVTFSSQTPLTCTLAGNTVTIVGVGTCTVRASQAGDAAYNPAPDVDQSFTINQASQTITFGALADKTYGDADFAVSATGGASGNPVTFSSQTPLTCTVAGSTVSIVAAGICTVRASQAGNANYTAAIDVDQSFTINQASQTITFGALADKTYGDADFAVSATGGASGNPVTFSSQTPLTCTLAGSTVSIVAAGTCTVRASQAGNANYSAAPDVDQSFTINQAGQTITFGALADKTFGDADFAVSATGGASGNPVTFSSQTPLTCTLAGSTVSIVAAGTCTVRASQAGNADYSAAPDVDQSFTINQASQTITFGALADKTFGDADFAVSATGGASGNPVTFSSQTPLTCTLAGSTVSIVAAGACTVRASQAGNADYSAAPDVDQSFTINQASQTITFGALADKTYGDADFAVSATGGASGNPVTFSSQTPLTCTLAGSTVSIVAAGTCTVRASQAGNADYSAAPDVDQSFTINQASQTITFGALADKTYGDADFAVSATGGASGNPVTFSSQTPLTCTLAGSTVSIVAAGACTVRASQAGNADYSAAPDVDQSFTINQASQTITFGALADKTYGDADFAVSATGGASGNPVTFSSQTPLTCTVAGSTVTIVGVGTCTVRASQAGNANYSAAPDVDQSFTINQASQTITFGALADKTYGDADFAVSATGGASGNPVTLSSQTPATCSVTGNTVTILAGGACTVRASQAGNVNYSAAPDVDQSFTINQAGQTITFGALADKTYGDADFAVSATGGASGNPVTFSSQTPLTCTVAGSTVTIVGVGTCTVRASQAGNANYSAAPDVDQSFTINQASQTISITSTAPVGAVVGGPVYTPTATGGASGNPVVFTIDAAASSVCSISGGDVSFLTIGTCIINANQAGNANYFAAIQVQQSFAVGLGSQTITFTSTAPANAIVGGATYTPTATGGGSGNPVVFTIDAAASSVCSISGGDVSFLTSGVCIVNANQAGNANYFAAPQAQQIFGVDKATPVVTWSNPADIVYGTALSGTQLNATASVAGAFTYTPASGTILNAGAGQTLSVDFVPTDTLNYNNVNGTTVAINVLKATPTLSVTNSPATYNGTPQVAIVVGSVPGTVSNILYDGSATAPTLEGTYAVTADFAPTDAANYNSLTAASAGNFVIKSNDYPTFSDVPTDYWAWQYIEAIYAVGITGGCGTSPLIYCPTAPVTRAQMAIFLLRGIHGKYYAPPPATGTVFTDVPLDYWAADWVEQLYLEGITGGCGDAIYCPDAPITRAQMAIFLLRTKYGSDYVPPVATGTLFIDVPLDYWAADWVEQLFQEDITRGCGDGNFCPDADVTRDQMAVFLQRLFDFPLP